MKFQLVENAVKSVRFAAGRGSLIAKKYAPTAMIIGGTIGVVASCVIACKATLKVDEIMDEANDKLDKIEEARKTLPDEKYSFRDYNSDKFKLVCQTGGKLLRLYGPALALGSVSLACILGSHGIMVKRNQAMGAAYVALQKAYDEYQERVEKKYGKDEAFNLKNGIEQRVVESVAEDGTKTEQKHNYISSESISEYAKIFDETNVNFSKDPEANLVFLRSQQNWANDRLQSRGHMFLNEVYDMLGFPRTTAGQIVGWIYDPKNPNIDSVVDFGIYDDVYRSEAKRDFINNKQPAVLLDFNVDGPIFEKIENVYERRGQQF